MAGDGLLLAENAARPQKQDRAERRRRSATICSAARARLLAGGNERGDEQRPDSAQKPQTSTAPRMAPRLLPEPPTISIAQTWKVSDRQIIVRAR